MVAALEEPRSEKEVSSAVSHLTALGVDGGHICRLIARLGGVRALLSLCLEPRLRQVRVASLRALATVCCVVEGIVELEKVRIFPSARLPRHPCLHIHTRILIYVHTCI